MKKRFLTSLVLALASIFASAQNQVTDTNKARMDALFQKMHDNITWGARATNGIQLGIAMFKNDSDKANKFGTFTYLYDETNFWIGLYSPNGYRLNLLLQDANGINVEKTKEGKAISKSVGPIIKTQMRIRSGRIQAGFDLLPQKTPMCYENPFNLLDCFDVEQAGTNTLTVGATIYKKSNDDGIYEIVLPPVSIRVSITQADIDNHRASKKDPQ
jgi:hypothetical protein